MGSDVSAGVEGGRANLDFLVEQLFAPALQKGDVRVVVDARPDPDWQEVETYWLVPNAWGARMLLPHGSARVTAAAARQYTGLRRTHTAAMKRAAAAGTRMGLPVSRHRLSVQVSRLRPEAAENLPLAFLRRALGTDRLYASMGVRTGDNRKATLALVDDTGLPVGYAKFGWDPVSDGYVRNETKVLAEVSTPDGPTRVPTVMASGEYFSHPVLITSPLPLDVRGSRRPVAPPTSEELYALMPVHRHAPVTETRHFQDLTSNLAALARDPLTTEVAGGARDLLERIRVVGDEPQPVTRRWHGDFTPWNRARDRQGQLWLWDWESSEPDAVAGMDALHWAFSLHRIRARQLSEIRLQACVDDVRHHLVAAGTHRRHWPIVASVYVLTVVQRACELAINHRSWETVWIGERVLAGLTTQARELLPSP